MKTHILTLGGVASFSFVTLAALCYDRSLWILAAIHFVLMFCCIMGYCLALWVQSKQPNRKESNVSDT